MAPLRANIASWTVATLLAGATLPASAAGLIANGGFEGGLGAWTIVDQLGSDGTFFLQSGTTSPVNAFAVPAPPEGANAAMTDPQAGGTHVLYQDFVVPLGTTSGSLSFSLFVNSGADFVTPAPATLDWSTTALNQQARVDILTDTLDPYSVDDVLLNAFQTDPGDALTSGYTDFTFDISALLAAHQGQTLRLRFAEADNVSFFNFGVDNVAIEALAAQVPEPAAASLALLALLALGGLTVQRRRR
jgi:MYXO-CTERM domain-containing protein